MGSLSSALGPLLQVGAAVGTKMYENSVANQQLKNRDKQTAEQIAAQTALQKQQNQLQLLQSETDRKLKLKQAVAQQRAQFGSQGLSIGDDGSSEAVLLGLFNNSDADGNYAQAQSDLKDQITDLNAAQIQQKNLLQQSQLREQQNLKFLTDSF